MLSPYLSIYLSLHFPTSQRSFSLFSQSSLMKETMLSKKQQYHHNYQPTTGIKPSFSSSLLDQIYNSIDSESLSSSTTKTNPKPMITNATKSLEEIKETFTCSSEAAAAAADDPRKRRTKKIMVVESWMESDSDKVPASTEKVVLPPPPLPLHPTRRAGEDQDIDSFFSTTSVSSSDSSSFGGFSENESFNGTSNPKSSCLFGPKPIKTTTTTSSAGKNNNSNHKTTTRSGGTFFLVEDHDGGNQYCGGGGSSSGKSWSARSRAVKIYSQLKSLKQPISPGVRLGRYINSLFMKEQQQHVTSSSTRYTKKKKKKKNDNINVVASEEGSSSVSVLERKLKSAQSSPVQCSSFSHYSTRNLILPPPPPPSRRSVRFQVEDEEKESRVKKLEKMRYAKIKEEEESRSLRRRSSSSSLVIKKMSHDNKCGARNHTSKEEGSDVINGKQLDMHKDRRKDDEDEDGCGSCTSSDLFELEHLSLIGKEELPIYESTII